MRSLFPILLLFLLCLQLPHLQAQNTGDTRADRPAPEDTSSLDLSGLAAFRVGDDDVWRSKYIDEHEDWNFIPVPGAWEDHGFPLLDGFAWYRIRFRLPDNMRDDSLLLVMSGVDDADETFLNGVLVGKSGSFPPGKRSELHALRVYPLPRFIREQFNLLAVRVYDHGDRGGLTGNILRIVRAADMHHVLDEIVDAPRIPPSRFITNGILATAISSDSGIVRRTTSHLYSHLADGLTTESILSHLSLSIDENDVRRPFVPDTMRSLEGTGILHASGEGIDVYWYHPPAIQERILVAAIRQEESDQREIGLQFVMDMPYWRYEKRETEHEGTRFSYHILAYHSCCDELVERDLDVFLERGETAWSLEAALGNWKHTLSQARFLPGELSEIEQQVYQQSLLTLLQAQVHEEGSAEGQIVSALQPRSQAVTHAADLLLAAEALAAAGLSDAAWKAMEFLHRAENGRYTLFDILGSEHGIGFPYLISPAPYFGNGEEWQWTRPDDALLRKDGMPRYIFAFEAMREDLRRRRVVESDLPDDSTFIARHWERLSTRVADIIMYQLGDDGLIQKDNSPWGSALTEAPGVYATILGARALRIAENYAELMKDDLKQFLYRDAATRAETALTNLARGVLTMNRADNLTDAQQRLFHPLICDAVSCGIFPAGSQEAAMALDIVENAFSIEDSPLLYHAEPGGDWFARQSRPQIALRLARACLAGGRLDRAEELFGSVTKLAHANGGILPELVNPVSGNWYGGRPHTASAADYILTAEAIALARLAAR